ncbi:terminase gpA endonuclease subunit [Desulfotignum phosphitoxidans]|uniref:Phage terminase large subunit GpA n=1 Tax=Desulfotignum phosphitoxidans DSM 13687 TaxID=1286635 RepID=S0G562_9BACT|nr:terminase gpA endonuclease subunit [Desulfotignum phosphitoxidans]EMS79186.1 phage terminase large subunit GpA [Desulfotignum phosphitoxidans DSM 13687]
MQLFKNTEKDPSVFQVPGRPAWCPESLWATLVGLMDTGRLKTLVQFSKAERRVLKKRRQIPPSVWAEKHRVLVKSVLPGLWKNSVTPYLVGIMDAAALPFVREVIVCKAPQTGVSEGAHNFIMSRVDMAPGDVLYVFPDESTARGNAKDRVTPALVNSTRLRSYLTGQEKDLSSDRINLQHLTIYFGWAGSVSSLANKPIRYAVADEIDKKNFGDAKLEASPLDLIDKRLNTYRSISKYIKISTPTIESGNIWQELTNNTDVIFDFHVRCPECGMLQLMTMERIQWPGGSKADPREIKNRKLAWYECEGCAARWDDNTRNAAARSGEWIARAPNPPVSITSFMEKFRPANVGFHLPAWVSYFVSLSECAAAFLLGLSSKKKLKDFRNSFQAMPWEEYEVLAKQEDEDVLRCRADLPPQVVPASAVALTAGFDLHKTGFPYVVRAWAKDYTSWLIDYGHLGTWEDLEQMLFETVWPVQESDRKLRIWRAGLDTGGGKYKKDVSSTEEAYLWLQKNMGFSRTCRVWGIKGSSNPLPGKLKMGSVLNKTPSGKALRMGMRLVLLDTDKMKDMFYERMAKALAGEGGGAWLHKETQLDYARQITAEEKQVNDKGVETWEPVRHDNHYLDCECIAAALADWEWPGGGVNLLPDPFAKKPETTNPGQPAATGRTGPRTRPSWFGSR